MKIIKPSVEIISKINTMEVLQFLEMCGRTCYLSEDKITGYESATKFLSNIIKNGHESVLEHYSFTVRFVCDRGVSHELVRHRIASFSQESTRYCNYGKDGEITFIEPLFWDEESQEYANWFNFMLSCEESYLYSVNEQNTKPQEARDMLPNSVKTTLVMTQNIRQWRHFFKLRVAKAAHPQMKELTIPLLYEVMELLPVLFDDCEKYVDKDFVTIYNLSDRCKHKQYKCKTVDGDAY